MSQWEKAVCMAVVAVTAAAVVVALAADGAVRPGDRTLQPRHPFTIVDSEGRVVGTADLAGAGGLSQGEVGRGMIPIVLFRIAGQSFALFVSEFGFAGNVLKDIVFELPACSGTPLVSRPADGVLPEVVIAQPGNTVYIPDRATMPRVITVQSRLPGATIARVPGPCSNPLNQFLEVVPAIPLIDLETVFTRPFHAR